MYRFAHLSDCHLGAQKQPDLRELEFQAFRMALDDALKNGADFIIIAGDLFHSNIPNMETVKRATLELRRVRDEGVPIYVNYGSHDYSPSNTSMIDILETAGVIEKVVRPVPGKKLGLEFTVDEKTGAKITGLSGRSRTLEVDYFMNLDREALEAEEGFRIFLFHSAITQFKPVDLAEMESVDLNLFPRGFEYYAGGHVHRRGCYMEEGYGPIVYPGTLFGSYAGDLEENARGEERGYYLVEFREKAETPQFRTVMPAEFEYIECDVTGKNSQDASNLIEREIGGHDVEGKVVMFKVRGELSSGRTSDIDSSWIRRELESRGARVVQINRHGLSTREIQKVRVAESDIPELERRIFREKLAGLDVRNRRLRRMGDSIAVELLRKLENEMAPGENKAEYERRIIEDAEAVMGVNPDDN
ncbi:DNA repair exonuclease [Methanothermobacter marburgensis]|uniref:DNA repair exonuclease n=1 Tax=Methanothermobacter marburgensis TaxID=145263 RepID=UPI0035BA7716